MLATLFSWIYISFLCWSWGRLVLTAFGRVTKQGIIFPDFSITCLSGLAFIIAIISILSLFMAIGSLFCQLLILIPAVLFFISSKAYKDLNVEIKLVYQMNLMSRFLLISGSFMTLILSSSIITHLDTIGYHAQTIEWIEKYKTIPGLVHLHRRYGYQGLWYTACAFFNFSFLKTGLALFINTTVLFWFFLFVIKKINSSLINKKTGSTSFLLWIGFLAMSLLSYNMARATATTPSPDFITVICITLVFYLFLDKESINVSLRSFLILLFSVLAITFKLSALPVLLFALIALVELIKVKRIRLIATILVIPFFLISSLITRNIITTGYVAFPTTIIDIFHTDWKYDKDLTALEKDYITAYARTHVSYTRENVEGVMNMKLMEWLPEWWKITHMFDKIILGLLMIAIVILLFRLKSIVNNYRYIIFPLIVSICGIGFWFIQAPDPRFGFGFIIPFICLCFSFVLKNIFLKSSLSKIFYTTTSTSLCLCILTYSGYKTINTEKIGLMWPMGLQKVAYKTIKIKGNTFNIPDDHGPCAGTPIPCVYDSCQTFELRGEKITDGFKAKKGYKPNSWHL